MTDRVGLQQKLETILGARHVYFQPPENLKITYPAIIYHLDTISDRKADNRMYNTHYRYEVILIDKDPDNQYIDGIMSIPQCVYGRTYIADNLNHYLFYIYH